MPISSTALVSGLSSVASGNQGIVVRSAGDSSIDSCAVAFSNVGVGPGEVLASSKKSDGTDIRGGMLAYRSGCGVVEIGVGSAKSASKPGLGGGGYLTLDRPSTCLGRSTWNCRGAAWEGGIERCEEAVDLCSGGVGREAVWVRELNTGSKPGVNTWHLEASAAREEAPDGGPDLAWNRHCDREGCCVVWKVGAWQVCKKIRRRRYCGHGCGGWRFAVER